MIYRMALVTENPIEVLNTGSDELQRREIENSYPMRTIDLSLEHGYLELLREEVDWQTYIASLDRPVSETTYFLDKLAHGLSPNVSLLMFNHRTRQEAISIFYGENSFWFHDIEIVVPFLNDRGPDARKHITNLAFVLWAD